jgi:hypothetical protein
MAISEAMSASARRPVCPETGDAELAFLFDNSQSKRKHERDASEKAPGSFMASQEL